MRYDLVSLAGDLVSENRRLAEGLKRLERDHPELIHDELQSLTRGLDRAGLLAQTLISQMSEDRLIPCVELLERSKLAAQSIASDLGRPLEIECRSLDAKIDRHALTAFSEVFPAMLKMFIEYCVEPQREREARGKNSKARLLIEAKPVNDKFISDGCRISVVCDGNGILPPLVPEHGIKLAKARIRASFNGRPGKWSAWFFDIASLSGSLRFAPVQSGAQRLFVPAWSIVEPAQKNSAPDRRSLCIAAGTHRVRCAFDEISELREAFMKPLPSGLSGNGKFLGVLVDEFQKNPINPDDVGALCLVLDPVYLVYGKGASA